MVKNTKFGQKSKYWSKVEGLKTWKSCRKPNYGPQFVAKNPFSVKNPNSFSMLCKYFSGISKFWHMVCRTPLKFVKKFVIFSKFPNSTAKGCRVFIIVKYPVLELRISRSFRISVELKRSKSEIRFTNLTFIGQKFWLKNFSQNITWTYFYIIYIIYLSWWIF